ncbi:MAG: S9 family peptidase [Proteobacteria bacterium]|nr:S9 family peptidase [Pseudomonadota bacterium]
MLLPNQLIPRHTIWADPDKHLVKTSLDGEYLSFLAPHHGILNLWLATTKHWQKAKAITFSEHPIRDYWWTRDYLLYIHDQFGDENWQLKGYQLSTGNFIEYTPAGFQVSIIRVSHKMPTKILIGLNKRDRHYSDVYLLDLTSKALTCVYENHTYWEFLADEDLNLKIGIKVDGLGGEYHDLLGDTSCIVARIALHDAASMYFYPRLKLALSNDKQNLYLAQSLESNTSTLMRVDLNSLHCEALANDEMADICDVLLCPISNTPLAVATNYERKQWRTLTSEIERDFQYLQGIDNGDIEVLSQTANNETWVVGFIHDNGPITYYLYHRKLAQLIHLFDSHQALKQYQFTKMHARIITARDGLKCVSYLSLPRQYDINEEGVPSQTLPLVLMVHGGPNYRDFWGFNPTHQWLTNRGYAVLSVNYRASTGFGKAHQAAGYGEWAGKIHTDLLDAVAWAIQQNITTADKVAIMGKSFGGYSTLVGLTLTPETFCCGVDIVGPSNLLTMVQHFPPYWQAFQGAIYELLGCDPNTLEGKAYLKERSPLYYADRITKPLLIGHGANDVRVKQEESDQMVNAMQLNKVPVTYAIFPDEGHQFVHPGNRMAFYALAESFLAKTLGGQVEPYDNKVATSMVVKVDDFGLSSV